MLAILLETEKEAAKYSHLWKTYRLSLFQTLFRRCCRSQLNASGMEPFHGCLGGYGLEP